MRDFLSFRAFLRQILQAPPPPPEIIVYLRFASENLTQLDLRPAPYSVRLFHRSQKFDILASFFHPSLSFSLYFRWPENERKKLVCLDPCFSHLYVLVLKNE